MGRAPNHATISSRKLRGPSSNLLKVYSRSQVTKAKARAQFEWLNSQASGTTTHNSAGWELVNDAAAYDDGGAGDGDALHIGEDGSIPNDGSATYMDDLVAETQTAIPLSHEGSEWVNIEQIESVGKK